jgi:dihydroorotate dehydrogenase
MDAYDLVKPLLFRLPAETAHRIVSSVLAGVQGTPAESAMAGRYGRRDPRLAVEAFGRSFPTPLGVAAGFDKNAKIPSALASLGFGHVEIGGVTAHAQAGNPRPRLFRLREDEAIVNRMGFNNDGADEIGRRLARQTLPDVPVGVNIGKSKVAPLGTAEEDYLYTYERVADHGDYFVVNVSSPNTPGLRNLQAPEAAGELVSGVLEALDEAGCPRPVLLKLHPDAEPGALAEVAQAAVDAGASGIVAVNTTTERPEGLEEAPQGGLSGPALKHRATRITRELYRPAGQAVPIVGGAGIPTRPDALAVLRAGTTPSQA